MPERSEIIRVDGYNASTLAALAYGTFEKLGWTAKYAGGDYLLAITPGTWHYTGEEVLLRLTDNELRITSKMVQGQAFDIKGTNKRHIREFKEALNLLKAESPDQSRILEWDQKLISLKGETAVIVEEELKQAEEVNNIMNLASGNMYITYGIIAINILVFLLMAINGVNFFSPTGEDIVKWGGNFGPYTTSGEWWRLLSNVFVHIGIIHLLFNMYALFNVGIYLEPMLGKPRFITAYLCTGVFASLVSLWWHNEPVASAGASGAIFGMFGVFLALLSTSLIPQKVRKPLLQNIGIFVAYNLIYGLKSGIDNAAHIGGLASGLVIGYIYYLDLRRKEGRLMTGFKPGLVIAITFLAAFFYLRNATPGFKTENTSEFSKTMEHFGALEELALEAMQPNDTTSKEAYLEQLKKTALNDWVHCVNLFEEADKMELTPGLEELRTNMLQYSKDRLQQTLLVIKATEEETDKYASGIDSIQKKIDQVIEKIKAASR